MTITYTVANLAALFGWMALICVPRWKMSSVLVMKVIVVLLSVAYMGLILTHGQDISLTVFNSFDDLKNLFSQDSMLLAGWLHYLAFDLFIGLFITEHAIKNNVPGPLLAVVQLLIFITGPIGFLLYYIYAAWKKLPSLIDNG